MVYVLVIYVLACYVLASYILACADVSVNRPYVNIVMLNNFNAVDFLKASG